jgi:hypothetical protein
MGRECIPREEFAQCPISIDSYVPSDVDPFGSIYLHIVQSNEDSAKVLQHIHGWDHNEERAAVVLSADSENSE